MTARSDGVSSIHQLPTQVALFNDPAPRQAKNRRSALGHHQCPPLKDDRVQARRLEAETPFFVASRVGVVDRSTPREGLQPFRCLRSQGRCRLNAVDQPLPLTAAILATFLAAVASLTLALTVASAGLVAATTAAALAPRSTAAVAYVYVSVVRKKMTARLLPPPRPPP